MRPADSLIGLLGSDDAILVVDKPAAMAVIPEGNRRDAIYLTEALGGQWGRLWVVHRIDRDTTGVVVLARTEESHRAINDHFAAHRVLKTYHLVVRGNPAWTETTVEARLRPDGDSRHRTVLDPSTGKSASTRFRVLERYGAYALVEACPETGRTHQIRVHAAVTGHPIVADPLYGDGEPLLLSSLKQSYKPAGEERPLLARMALHAFAIEMEHPVSGSRVAFSAPYRKDMAVAVAQLARYRPR